MKRKTILVAVSGGFDPIHIGHVRMIQEAKKLGDKLVADYVLFAKIHLT